MDEEQAHLKYHPTKYLYIVYTIRLVKEKGFNAYTIYSANDDLTCF
jgi:hypothetical protein